MTKIVDQMSNRLRANADTLEELGYEAFAEDDRLAADELDLKAGGETTKAVAEPRGIAAESPLLPDQLLDVHAICDQRDHFRAALQKIESKDYGCCGADRVARDALQEHAT
jgi:hypothetical protein